MESDYERQLRESNEHLREKLAEALNILDEKKRILDEKVKKYGKNKEMGKWENMGATWKAFKDLNPMTKNSKSK
jgi:predicted phage-related endonuclease